MKTQYRENGGAVVDANPTLGTSPGMRVQGVGTQPCIVVVPLFRPNEPVKFLLACPEAIIRQDRDAFSRDVVPDQMTAAVRPSAAGIWGSYNLHFAQPPRG